MSTNFDDFNLLLVTTSEITNFLIAIPIQLRAAQAVVEVLISDPSKLLIVDEDSVFMGEAIQFILAAINCQLRSKPFQSWVV